jgi:hypothetical protein
VSFAETGSRRGCHKTMPTRSVTAAAVALAVVCPAYADTNVTVRRTGEERAADDDKPTPEPLRFGETNGHVVKSALAKNKVTIEIAGRDTSATNVDVPIALPAGTRVTGLTVSIGGVTQRAELIAVSDARSRYRSIVGWRNDPALLEHELTSQTSEQFTLHVFPVTAQSHAVVTLELGHGDAAVDPQLALVAGNAVPIVTLGSHCGGYRFRGLDKSIIRRYVKLRMEKLANCYQRELLGHPTLAGTAELHFTIQATGRVEDISVDGTLDSETARQCLAEELTTWHFSPTDDKTRVNYPLTFKIAGT